MLTVWDWFGQRSFNHTDFSELAGLGTPHPSVTLILPTREVAGTIGPILDTVARLNERSGLVSQVVVVDADSADGTADIARSHDAEVYSENELCPEFGPAQGKGDAMWRALSVAHGDIIMYADTDTTDFEEHFIYGTLGPLLTVPGVKFCKAAYRRPFAGEVRPVADGGGRVTELMAKPLLNFFYPELTGFVQPLAGEFAVSRDLLLRTPFLTGYGVEIALLIDVLGAAGLEALSQVDLGSRQNRHQPLFDLTRMSSAVLRALARRVPGLGPGQSGGGWEPDTYLHAVATQDGLRFDEHLSELLERPPMAGVLAQAEVPAALRGACGVRFLPCDVHEGVRGGDAVAVAVPGDRDRAWCDVL
jgi:glucosyl-3-phosphoglycerate synthase